VLTLRKWMPRMGHHHQRLLKAEKRGDLWVKKGSRHEAEMNVMFIEHLNNLSIVSGMNSHINMWIGLVEACHRCGKKAGCQRW